MSLYSLPRGCLAFLLLTQLSLAQDVLVEAEGFEVRGGWLIDTQFIDLMGSPYLLAHGMGQPVADAEAEKARRGWRGCGRGAAPRTLGGGRASCSRAWRRSSG